MSTLECFSSILGTNAVALLKQNNIRTILDFLHESPENIGKILKLSFKDVLNARQKVVDTFRKKPCTALELLNGIRENYFILSTGIPEVDQLISGLESGRIYELCGLSGCGKTQICLNIAAHVSFSEKRVLYIDTKNDFSASKVYKILTSKCREEDVTLGLERIKVTKVFNLHKLVDVLHWLKNVYELCHIPLIIIDCISTCYFGYVGGDQPLGFAMLNHIASLMKYIVTQNHSVILITNLATRGFHAVEENQRGNRSIKPCLGSYWQQVSNVRLDLKKEKDPVVEISLQRNDIGVTDIVSHINLSRI